MTAAMLAVGFVGGVIGARVGGVREADAQSSAITASTLTAQEFRLVDAQGKLRLRAGITADNSVYFNLRGADETIQIVLGWQASGAPAIQLADGAGMTRASLDLQENASSLTIYDGQGAERAFVGQAFADGDPFIRLRRADKSTSFSAP